MIKNKDILKKVEKIIEIGNIKDRKIIKNIIGYGFEKRKIETREKEDKTMAVLCHYDDCRFFGSSRCTHPRKKENGGQFILPVFKPGKVCIWGERKFDPADFLRAQIAISEMNREKR